MTTPEGQPEAIGKGWIPDEVEWEPVVREQSPLTPVFDEVTRPSTLCTRCSIGSSAERACG